MSRENIVSEITSKLKNMTSPTLKKVERDPIQPEELAKTAFPAVYIETTDEDIEDITLGSLRSGTMEVNVVCFVGGHQRDKQRNAVVEGIESALLTDRSVNNTATHIALTGVESIAVGESAPYASVRMVFTVKHHYQL